MIAHREVAQPAGEYPVFIKRGDARREVEAVAGELGMDATAAGLRKSIYAAKADQTVVLVTRRDSPLAAGLRARGWQEPRDEPGAGD